MEYLLTGDRFPVARAVELGRANPAVPRNVLLARATAFAAKAAGPSPQAVQDTMSLLDQHLRRASVSALGFGVTGETHSHGTPEYLAVADRFRGDSAIR